MTDRVLHYYQAITDPAFAKYMIEQTGSLRSYRKSRGTSEIIRGTRISSQTAPRCR